MFINDFKSFGIIVVNIQAGENAVKSIPLSVGYQESKVSSFSNGIFSRLEINQNGCMPFH